MEISSNMPNVNINQNNSVIKSNYTEKISSDDVKEIRAEITKNAQSMMMQSTSVQANVANKADSFEQQYNDFKTFLSDIGYEGKPIAELSQEEATDLVSEDGIFGIDKTSTRIAEFVINGAGGDEDKMRAGREGMLQGFKDAEEMWGGELPEISQKTMEKALEMVDMAMNDLGFPILDKEV